MRKSVLAVIAVALLAALPCAAQNLGRLAGVVFAGDRGAREAATLNDIISAVGSREITIVLDTGVWTIDETVSVPSTIALVVLPGADINISAGVTMTIAGPLLAGDYSIFSGSGYAAGTAAFGYRYASWGDTTQFDVGSGKITNSFDIMFGGPAVLTLATWYTNATTPGVYVMAYASSTNLLAPGLRLDIVDSGVLATTTVLMRVVAAASNAVAALTAPVPYGYFYRVSATNAAVGTAYSMGLIAQ